MKSARINRNNRSNQSQRDMYLMIKLHIIADKHCVECETVIWIVNNRWQHRKAVYQMNTQQHVYSSGTWSSILGFKKTNEMLLWSMIALSLGRNYVNLFITWNVHYIKHIRAICGEAQGHVWGAEVWIRLLGSTELFVIYYTLTDQSSNCLCTVFGEWRNMQK